MTKNEWRERLKTLKFDAKISSSLICEKIISWDMIKKYDKIALYYPLKDEIDLRQLKHLNKKIYLPRFCIKTKKYEFALWDNTPLKTKKFGILEPHQNIKKASSIDLAFIPALGFDKQFKRLGRGRGFYDQLLQDYPCIKVGICPNNRLIEKVFPLDSWDKKMDYLITEKEILKRK